MSIGPVLVAHADWSVSPRKRWLTLASPAQRSWRVRVEPVGDLATLLDRLRKEAGSNPVLLGVDAPIGLPQAYVQAYAHEFDGFLSFLAGLLQRPEFFEVCAEIGEVSHRRPFYPRAARPGVSPSAHRTALGIAGHAAMLRRCERGYRGRPAAAPLFWTLGAKQVGKAALVLWRDLLLTQAPALAPALWPFEGELLALLRTRPVTVAETYPAEALRQLEIRLDGSKRSQSARGRAAERIRATMQALGAVPAPSLERDLADGFGANSTGEDRFDSLMGLLGMLQVLLDPSRGAVPDEAPIRQWEGWILGQRSLPSHAVPVHPANGDVGATK